MTPPIDIRADHLRIVQDVLHRHLPAGVKVWVFGSRASWATKDSSDLDLALEGDGDIPPQSLSALEAAFEESDLPFTVDIVDVKRINERFRRIVTQQRVRLPEGDRRPRSTHEKVTPCSTPLDGRSSEEAGEWTSINLGQACTKIGSGATPRGGKEIYTSSGPYALIRSQNVFNDGFHHDGLAYIGEPHASELAGVEVLDGDVLLNITGDSVARACQVDPHVLPARVNQHVAIIRPDPEELDAGFLRYFLVSPETQTKLLSWAGSGGTRNALTKGMIETVEVPAPQDVHEQRAIGHILGTLDDKIELNRRINATLEALARALFTSWFVDFDPVRAKLESRDTGLPKDIADLFPNLLVDSEVGEIPEGWRLRPLDSLAHFQNGLALQRFRPAENEARLPVVKIAQLRAGEANSREWASSTIKPECIIENGDVVFSWSGSLLVRMWCGGRAALNQHLFKVTSEEYPKWFYLHSILSHFPEFQRTAKDKTTTMGHIRRHHLTDALCVVPPDGVIAQVSEMFEGLLDRQVANKVAGGTLATLRDTLLPQLVSGELRVNVLEAAFGRDDRHVSVAAQEA